MAENNNSTKIIAAILLFLGIGYLIKTRNDKKTIKPSNTQGTTGDIKNNEDPIKHNPLPSLPMMIGVVEPEFTNKISISGWAANMDDIEKPTKVDIFIDGVKVSTVDCNRDRKDIKDYIENKYFSNNGELKNIKYGFYYKIRGEYQEVGTHNVKVVFSNTQENLTNSPTIYTVEGTSNIDTFYNPIKDNGVIKMVKAE